MPREVDTHAREQAKANARYAVENAEESPEVAAQVAIAYALLDIADAIRSVGRMKEEGAKR